MRRRTDCRIARRKLDNTGARFSSGAGFPALPEYYPPADAPGLARSVEAFLLSFSGRRCPFRLRSKKDRLLGHGFVRTGDSRIDARNRIGYRPVDTATGVPCFARKHGTPLASSDRTRDSIPHGVHSPDSGAKHLRYLGTGCSDRWLPISRTASCEHLPPQTNASISCSANSIEDDFRSQYPKPAGPKSRRFLAGCDFGRRGGIYDL